METSIILQQVYKKMIEKVRDIGIGGRLIKLITIFLLLFSTTLMSSCFFRAGGEHRRHGGHYERHEHHDEHHDEHR